MVLSQLYSKKNIFVESGYVLMHSVINADSEQNFKGYYAMLVNSGNRWQRFEHGVKC
jgi:hypothetical protein